MFSISSYIKDKFVDLSSYHHFKKNSFYVLSFVTSIPSRHLPFMNYTTKKPRKKKPKPKKTPKPTKPKPTHTFSVYAFLPALEQAHFWSSLAG